MQYIYRYILSLGIIIMHTMYANTQYFHICLPINIIPLLKLNFNGVKPPRRCYRFPTGI